MELVTIATVAEILGVSPQRADALSRRDGFPAPVADLGRRRVWDRATVERWARKRPKGKAGRPRVSGDA